MAAAQLGEHLLYKDALDNLAFSINYARVLKIISTASKRDAAV